MPRIVPRDASVRQLDTLTDRRNKIAHTADRKGHGVGDPQPAVAVDLEHRLAAAAARADNRPDDPRGPTRRVPRRGPRAQGREFCPKTRQEKRTGAGYPLKPSQLAA